jgi:hypothetical protein
MWSIYAMVVADRVSQFNRAWEQSRAPSQRLRRAPTAEDAYKILKIGMVRLICSPVDNWIAPTSLHEAGEFIHSGVWVHCNLCEMRR